MKQLWWAIPIVGSIALTGYAMSEMQDKAATSPTPKLKLQLSGDVVNEGVPPSPDAFARFACASHKMPDIDYFGKPLPKGRISLIMGGDCTTCSLVPKVLLGHFKTKYPAVFVVQADASRFEKNRLKNYASIPLIFDKDGKFVDQKILRGFTYEIWHDETGFFGGREAIREN